MRIEDTQHPVIEGLENFRKCVELWENIYVSAADATVLSSNFASKEFKGDDVWEPAPSSASSGRGAKFTSA